jgi:hypothetical protein
MARDLSAYLCDVVEACKARGVDITHQITDAPRIAMGGIEGNRFKGFGFPDQAIVWDGSAVETTYRYLIQTQHDPTPVRTDDQSTTFGTSVAGGAVGGAAIDGARRSAAINQWWSRHQHLHGAT